MIFIIYGLDPDITQELGKIETGKLKTLKPKLITSYPDVGYIERHSYSSFNIESISHVSPNLQNTLILEVHSPLYNSWNIAMFSKRLPSDENSTPEANQRQITTPK